MRFINYSRTTTPNFNIPDFSGSEPCDATDDVDCAEIGGGGRDEFSGYEPEADEASPSSSDFNFNSVPTRDDAHTPEMIAPSRRTTPATPPRDPSSAVTRPEQTDNTMTSSVGATSSFSSFDLNLTLLVGISLGLLILIFILVYAVYKYRKRDEGVYKIDNTKNVRYESVNTKAPSSDSNGVAASKQTNASKSSKKKGPVKEWYV